MHKTKKKTAKLPKPIKVKKEKSDEERHPQPMSHYIDDRLELVKQVFGTLKPKTIINLAPDFLKTQELEDIEEACLNELLCISTKRLKSIINATKCPTDTESSDDNDDDVQRQEEHVSLEEISSDSEIEDGTSKKGKRGKKSGKSADKDKANTKTDKTKTNDGNANNSDGQVSVLELLELQARARAIRSQLALEPVTKIEVDSDGDGGSKGKSPKQKSKKDKKSSNKSSERKRTSSTRESQDSSSTNKKPEEKETEQKTKKIKLKRNYRNAASSATQIADGTEQKNNEERYNIEKENPSKPINEKEGSEVTNDKVKKERRSRSASPDVIPIVAEPETLLIDDSSDETEVNSKTTSKDSSEKPLSEIKVSDIEEGELEAETNKVEDNIKSSSLSKDNKDLNENKCDKGPEVSLTISEENKSQETEKSNQNPDKNKASAPPNALSADEDEDQNDDIISLGEDLEDEMNEQLENEVNSSTFAEENSNTSAIEKSQKQSHKENSKASEEKPSEDDQSWHSRYMKSSKVSKVLAASRLGKRVRDKIKSKSKDTPRETVEADKEEPVFTSKHEEGSLDQYKELLELRNRKSK